MTLTVAIEGPSDSGKSTLIASLSRHFAHLEPMQFPCYVDDAGGEDKVPQLATTRDDQLRAIDFFLGLESGRYRRLRDGGEAARLVLLDRSAYTLVAHSYAVAQSLGADVFEQCKVKVATGAEVIIPDVVLYLDVDVEAREERADPEDRDKWFTNTRFNDEIRTFFLERFPDCETGSLLHVIDANQPAETVLQDAATIISSNLR